MIKKFRRIRITYGLALATMASSLSALHAYADDNMQPVVTETRPPQIAPAANNGVPTLNSGSTQVLGTLPTGSNTGSMSPNAADVPLVAPVEPSQTSWEEVLPPQKAGDVTYITGGIGDEERAALGEAKKDFNVHIMSSNKDGSFLGDTRIVIRSLNGNELLNTDAGPLLYAKLPAGSYTVEGFKGGQSQKEKIKISTKSASNIGFNW